MPATRRTTLAAGLAAALLTLAPAAAAHAQTIFTDRAAFLAAFPGGTATNSLNGFDVSAGGLNPAAGIDFGPITTGTLVAPVPGTAELNFANVADVVSWIVADGGVTRLELADPVVGVGASLFDAGSVGDVAFRLLLGGQLVGSAQLGTTPGFPYTGFFGLGSAVAFDVLEIEALGGEFFELDDPVVAAAQSAVPEPGSALLLGVGGLALAGWRVRGARRRRAG